MMQEYTTNSGLFNVVNDANQQARCKRTRRICQGKSEREEKNTKYIMLNYIYEQKGLLWFWKRNNESMHLLRGQSVRSFQGTSNFNCLLKTTIVQK